MTWTTGKPKRPGWYWYRATPTTEPHPVKIFDAHLLYVWPVNDRGTKQENVTVPLSYCSGEWAGPLMPELVMEPEEEIANERFEARKHCAEDILKEALKQQKEPGWYRREPITDPYSTKVRIGSAIVVFTASILFLSVFPA